MLKIRPISGDLTTSVAKTQEIPATLMSVFNWLQQNYPTAVTGNHYCHDDIRFVKHGHSNDAEWGQGYLIYVDSMPCGYIDREIPQLNEQRENWDRTFKQMRDGMWSLLSCGMVEMERREVSNQLSAIVSNHLQDEHNATEKVVLYITRDQDVHQLYPDPVQSGRFSTDANSKFIYYAVCKEVSLT